MAETLHALKYPFAVDGGGGRAAEESDYEAYVRQLIRQVLLTARLAPTSGGQAQLGKVEFYLDALVGMSGAVSSLRVLVGDMVG